MALTEKLVSHDLERLVLAGLLKYPAVFDEVCDMLNEFDFEAQLCHKVIFSIIKRRLEAKQEINVTIIIQEINNASIRFKEVEDVFAYINEGICLLQTTIKGTKEAVQELKKITVARELIQTAKHEESLVRRNLDKSPQDIIDLVDAEHNSRISVWKEFSPVSNIFQNLEEIIEERGNNPIQDFGMMSPFLKLNELYGSIVRPGNIFCCVARAGAAKSTLLLNLGIHYADKYDVPIIALDNGELTLYEQQMRAAACLSGVPIGLCETGKWRMNAETERAIRSIWPKIKKLKYNYIQVGGKSTNEMISLVRRAYYNKVGRGNPTVLIFDYFKSYNEVSNQKEYEIMGKIVQEFKDFITGEIPMGMVAACQSNRSGITTNRTSNQVTEDESIVGGSDRITFYSSHLFLLRKKTLDAIAFENNQYGNFILMPLKTRHLGINVTDAINPVKMTDGNFKSNYLHLDITNFRVKELGDLKSTVGQMGQLNIQHHNHDDNIKI